MNRTQYIVSAVSYENQIEAMCFDGFENLCSGFEEYLSGWAGENTPVQIIVQEPDGVIRKDEGDLLERVADDLYGDEHPDNWPQWALDARAHGYAEAEAHEVAHFGTWQQQESAALRRDLV